MTATFPDATNNELWSRLPESSAGHEIEYDGAEYDIYRNDDRVFSKDLGTGKPRSITRNTAYALSPATAPLQV